MRKTGAAILLILLLLNSCALNRIIEPGDEQPELTFVDNTAEIPIHEARERILEAEYWDAWFSLQSELPRVDAIRAGEKYAEKLGEHHAADVITRHISDIAGWQKKEILQFGNGTVSPTLFHEGIEIVSATESRSCGLDKEGRCVRHRGRLVIRLEYTGQDPTIRKALEGWHREYHFETYHHDAELIFASLAGYGNFKAKAAIGDIFLLRDEFYEYKPD